MIIDIKKILTEDSELLQSVRENLENSLSSANARGKRIEQLTKTPSPHISDKPLKKEDIQESVILTKKRFLSEIPIINKSASNELSKEGLANVDRGAKAVANSPINSLLNNAASNNGSKKIINESTDPNFGKVHSKSTEGSNLIPSTSTQAAVEEKGKMQRSNNKKLIAGVTESNPANLINTRKKDGISALISIQRNR